MQMFQYKPIKMTYINTNIVTHRCQCPPATSLLQTFTNCVLFCRNSWDLIYITISGLLSQVLPGNNTSMTSDELRRTRTPLPSHHEVLILPYSTILLQSNHFNVLR